MKAWLFLLLLLALFLVACSRPAAQPPGPTAAQALWAKEGIACEDFFTFDEGAVRLSCAELVAQWNHAKALYQAGRPGLQPAEVARLAAVRLDALFSVHGQRPTSWRPITALDGHQTQVAEMTVDAWSVQAEFQAVPFVWIDYANPYALPCEYFHFFELAIRGAVAREPDFAVPEALFVYQIIGHCTPDDPMQACCWSSTAYDVPAGR